MVSMRSPAATVTAVPPSQLQLPDDVGLRSTDPVASDAAPEFTATDVLVPERGCGACAVCACGIPAVGAGLLREANGLSLNRDVSPLQAATLIVTSASTAARGESRERNISKTPDLAPYSYATPSVPVPPC